MILSVLRKPSLTDGGLLRNRPIDYFDEMHYQDAHIHAQLRYQRRTNPETLGLCLEASETDNARMMASLAEDIEQLEVKDELGLTTLVRPADRLGEFGHVGY